MISLGTERHRKYLKQIDDMSVIGCFALTELGFLIYLIKRIWK